MSFEIPSAIAIDRKLREDFRARVREFGISAETTDPILATMFRTFAVEIEALYGQTDKIRLALLDELIEGIGIERRRARAAQTVVRFEPQASDTAAVEAGVALVGEDESGGRLTFTTDAPITASRARIAAAFVYQQGALQLLSGVEPSEEIQAARPASDPVRAQLGPHPAVWLAIENLPEAHLGRHGFFFDLSPGSTSIEAALKTQPWRLADADGVLTARGVLRPRRINAGVRQLQWLLREGRKGSQGADLAAPEAADLPDGYYAGRIAIFPTVPPDRRWLCAAPKNMRQPLERILGPTAGAILETERAWVQIPMPPDSPSLIERLLNISLHAVTASNAELVNQTIRFEEHGTSIPISREDGARDLLVAPLSVFGESRQAYAPQFAPDDTPGRGRYSIQNGRIRLEPARRPDGSREEYANLRLWLTGGRAANRVGPGKIQTFFKRGSAPAVRIINPTSAAGGTDGESFDDARRRFAAALLTRGRLVTQADVEAAVKAFDPRIVAVESSLGVRRGPSGALERTVAVRAEVDADGFAEPAEEMRILAEELDAELAPRAPLGVRLALDLRPREAAR